MISAFDWWVVTYLTCCTLESGRVTIWQQCRNVGSFIYCRFGHLSDEMFRACRLVADTGLHAMQYVKNCICIALWYVDFSLLMDVSSFYHAILPQAWYWDWNVSISSSHMCFVTKQKNLLPYSPASFLISTVVVGGHPSPTKMSAELAIRISWIVTDTKSTTSFPSAHDLPLWPPMGGSKTWIYHICKWQKSVLQNFCLWKFSMS